MAWFAGALARPIVAENGILRWEQIRKEIRAVSPHYSPTGLVEVENTANIAGGTVYPMDVLNEICDGAHAAGLKVHMDGARVFNAATALGRDAKSAAMRAFNAGQADRSIYSDSTTPLSPSRSSSSA